MFKCAKFGKTWFTLDADAASRELKEPRDRIVAALNYLEERGDLIVEATGARQEYRRLQLPEDREELVASLAERFLEREANDIARVESVVAMAEHDGCITCFLLEYFGETRETVVTAAAAPANRWSGLPGRRRGRPPRTIWRRFAACAPSDSAHSARRGS